jgi:hypothetical protein
MATVRDMRTGEQLTPMMEKVGEVIRGKLGKLGSQGAGE